MLHPIYIIELSIGGLSILSSFFNISIFILFESIRTEATELIFCLSISSIMTNISYIIQFTEDETVSKTGICQAQGFLMIWFEFSQAIWATLISYSVYNNIINNDNKHTRDKRVKYIIIGFIAPFFISLSSYITGIIGYSGYWCWMDMTTNFNVARIIYIMAFSFFWSLFFVSFYFIRNVIIFLEKNYTDKTEKEIIYKYIKKIRLYPMIQVMCMIPCTLNRFIQLFGQHFIIFDYLIVIFFSIQGFLYALVFGFNPFIKDRLKEFFQKYCNCCLGEDQEKKGKEELTTELSKK